MKIAIDARSYYKNGGGISLYIQKLIEFLVSRDNTVVALCQKSIHRHDFPDLENSSNLIVHNLDTESSGANEINETIDNNISSVLKKYNVSIYHCPNNWGLSSKNIGVKSVLTIHDLIPFDFREASYKDETKFEFYKKSVSESIKNASKIITISQFSKDEIITRFPESKNKIEVIHNGIGKKDLEDFGDNSCTGETLDKYEIKKGKYFICVGGFYERKNLSRMLSAFIEVVEKNSDVKLVVAGDNIGNEYVRTQANIFMKNASKIKNNIVITGFIEGKIKNILIKNSAGLVYPSLYEGFGLPVVEGMFLGVPVLCSNTTSLPEVGGGAPYYFDPLSIYEIKQAMLSAISNTDLNKKKIEIGEAIAEKFDWDETFRKVYDIYKELI